jgi:hypothetical protein
MQSINTEQNQRERIRLVRKNKIWELALVGFVGIVLGGLIVWAIRPSHEPPSMVSPPSPTPDPSKTQLEFDPPSRLADGSHRTLIRVNLYDQAGKPVPNQVVQVTSTEKTDILQDTTSTNQEGVAFFPITYSQPGTRKIAVLSNGKPLVQRDRDFLEVPQSEPPVTVEVGEATLQEDGRTHVAALELTVRERGVLLGNTQIQVISDHRSDTLFPEIISTNPQGKATVRLTYHEPGQRTFTVKRNGNPWGQDDVTLPEIQTRVVEPPVTVGVVEATLQEDGRIRADLKLTIRNEDGTLLRNADVQVTSDHPSDLLSMSVHTDAQGQATVPFTYEKPGQRTITIKRNRREVGGAQIELPKIQLPEPPPKPVPTQATVRLERTALQENDSKLAVLIITVKDAAGTPLEDVPMTIVSDKGEAIFPATVNTNPDGQASCSLTYEQPGTRQMTVNWKGKQLGQFKIDLPAITPPKPATKRLVRVKVEGNDKVLLTDATVQMNGKLFKANQNGVFETEVEANQNTVDVEVETDGYETLQGKSIYKETLPLDAGDAVYFFPVILKPVLYYTEVPSKARKKLPSDPNASLDEFQFWVSASRGDPRVEVRLITDRKRFLFPFNSKLKLDQNSLLYFEIWQRGRSLWDGQLPVSKHE